MGYLLIFLWWLLAFKAVLDYMPNYMYLSDIDQIVALVVLIVGAPIWILGEICNELVPNWHEHPYLRN